MWLPLLTLLLPTLLEGQKLPRPPTNLLNELLHVDLSLATFDNVTGDISHSCQRDLDDLKSGISTFQDFALHMIDSSTKLQSGILTGNTVDLGQFDECVDVQRGNYTGQHCLVDVVILIWNGTAKVPYSQLTMAYCLPSTCSDEEVTSVMNSLLGELNDKLRPLNTSLMAKTKSCVTKGAPPLTYTEWIVIAVCIVLGALVGGATVADYFYLNNKDSLRMFESALKCFSLYTNWPKLLSVQTRGGEMTSINGIKFYSMAWVILGHKYGQASAVPEINLSDLLKFQTEWTKLMIYNATLSVDSFFLVSGLLNAFLFFTVVNKKKSYTLLDVLLSYLHRFLRLTPAYAMMMALTGSVLYFIGTGPYWRITQESEYDVCQSHWWLEILYVNNFFSKGYCVGQGWYLATDMQLFWLSPFLLYPMWRWPLFGLIALVGLTGGSIITAFVISYVDKFTSPIPIGESMERTNLQNYALYNPPYTRAAPYLVGIAVGYAIYLVRSGKLVLRISKLLNLALWTAAGILMFYSIFGGYWFIQVNNPYSETSDALYIAFFRFLWALGLGWTIFACDTRRGGVINRILSWKPLWPLARLTYCTYLTHMKLLSIKSGLVRTTGHLDDFTIVIEYIGEMLLSLVAGLVLSLVVEVPFMALEKLLLGNIGVRKARHSGEVHTGRTEG